MSKDYSERVTISQMEDHGTYTLRAENRNGSDSVDLDLIVLDPMKDCDCDMFKSADLGCACSLGFRHENTMDFDVKLLF